MQIPYIEADRLAQLVPWTDAVDALAAALEGGPEPGRGPARSAVALRSGQLLLMPAESPTGVGVKLVTVSPEGAVPPRVKGVYVLFDADSLSPVALVDGAALTTVRTASVSALAVRHLAAPDARRLVIFGAGPQGEGHLAALCAVRPIEEVTVVTRDPAHAQALVDRAPAGVRARAGDPSAVADADVVVCATTARTPLFDGAVPPDHACVVAIGSHQPDAREIDETVVRRATRVVVEDRVTAMREAGDLVMAVAAGAVDAESLVELADVVRTPPSGSPGLKERSPQGLTVFKGTGMAWQDLAVVEAAVARLGPSGVPA